ncbi:unnamed protein product [Parajaminaea phylloscopi]
MIGTTRQKALRGNGHLLAHGQGRLSSLRSQPPRLTRSYVRSAPSPRRVGHRALVGASVVVAATAVAVAHMGSGSSPLHNEAAPVVTPPGAGSPIDPTTPVKRTQQEQMQDRAQLQGVYAWGSNRYNVVAPDSPSTTLVKTPRSIPYFAGMALRDIVLEEKHGVAVDAHGDVVQWGLGFFDPTSRLQVENLEEAPLGRRREKEKANELAPRGSQAALPREPVKTLIGKNIVQVAANDEKVYALSQTGEVYVFAAQQHLQHSRKSGKPWSANPLTLFGTFAAADIDYAKITMAPSVSLARGDRVTKLAAGTSHLAALTKQGRVFSLPIDQNGNAFGQLGSRRVLLNAPATSDSKPSTVEAVMEPRLLAQLADASQPDNATTLAPSQLPPPSTESGVTSRPQPQAIGTATDPPPAPVPLTEPVGSIRYCTTLSEIPSLKNVAIAEIAVGNEHCLARTPEGRVLAWGRHTHGQLGLGSNFSIECIPVPSEVVLAKCFPSSSRDVRCTGLAAGGDNSFFVTERKEEGRLGTGNSIDVLAAGKGQWGTLGNAMWSQVKPDPTRVKTVSGLMEFSERTNLTHPVPIHTISVGRPGHVAVVLDTVETEGHVAFGRDVMVFGHNAAYQLGTGKRSNLAVPQHLHPLPPPTPVAGAPTPLALNAAKDRAEAVLNSGSLTHMPHNRLQLAPSTSSNTRGSPGDEGGQGKQKKGATIEETISAGTVSMAVWWKCAA